MKWDTYGVAYGQLRVKVNETEYLPPLTASDGFFSLSVDLQPKDNQATVYMISASFEDNFSQRIIVTAWAYTLDGQHYTVCVTIYGYLPVSNSTTITAKPQSSEVVVPTKTPEQLQKEAKQKGWLRVQHKFSIWYPWYRLHVNISLNS